MILRLRLRRRLRRRRRRRRRPAPPPSPAATLAKQIEPVAAGIAATHRLLDSTSARREPAEAKSWPAE